MKRRFRDSRNIDKISVATSEMNEEEERRMMAGIKTNPLDALVDAHSSKSTGQPGGRERLWWEFLDSVNIIEISDDRAGRGWLTLFAPKQRLQIILAFEDWEECARTQWMMARDPSWSSLRPIPKAISIDEYKNECQRLEAYATVIRKGQISLSVHRSLEMIIEDLSAVAQLDLHRLGVLEPDLVNANSTDHER
eukprot:CAMPEP_0167748498 /NCGR_PEP_ID=MMETSP0110_2-20121227/4871_1 /TAXON_ID=629695 /ORGANISM="Gymnochlora sp., Strain CCMP2014" /LENGTH=193 /DNA_ID=CAMNT_0007633519 /DNA_START=176 /DNA_END=757 /DNA_ORIENTATION=+